MPTYFPFTPSTTAVPQFQATLDGEIYTVSCPFNFHGQRYFVAVQDLSLNTVLYEPLIGSPPSQTVETMTNGGPAGVTITTSQPHGYAVGATLNLTVSGVTPDDYDGLQSCLVTGPSTLTFQSASVTSTTADASVPGTLGYVIDLLGGYFEASTMAYYPNDRQFAVTP